MSSQAHIYTMNFSTYLWPLRTSFGPPFVDFVSERPECLPWDVPSPSSLSAIRDPSTNLERISVHRSCFSVSSSTYLGPGPIQHSREVFLKESGDPPVAS